MKHVVQMFELDSCRKQPGPIGCGIGFLREVSDVKITHLAFSLLAVYSQYLWYLYITSTCTPSPGYSDRTNLLVPGTVIGIRYLVQYRCSVLQ